MDGFDMAGFSMLFLGWTVNCISVCRFNYLVPSMRRWGVCLIFSVLTISSE